MHRFAASLVRVSAVTVLTAAGLIGILWATSDWSPPNHSATLVCGVAIFVSAEFFFGRLLNDLNAVLLSTGVSLWQADEFRQLILPYKVRLWRLWWLSVLLKLATATAGLLLSRPSIPEGVAKFLPAVGYAALLMGLPVLWVMVRGFRAVEKLRTDLAYREVQFKERKKLRDDLGKGQTHDFDKDAILQGYSKPAEPL